MLFTKASRGMHPHELEWLASGATEHIGSLAHSLSIALAGIGCMVSAGESLGVGKDDVAHLMHSLSHQLDTISGLANIADDAGFLALEAPKGAKS